MVSVGFYKRSDNRGSLSLFKIDYRARVPLGTFDPF